VMQYDWDVFKGPRAGEHAIDFPLTDLDGNEVRISDFRGKWLVIETGSSNCSIEHADMHKLKASRGVWIAVKTMWTGGIIALGDFVAALPKLARHHKLVDEYYAKHGRFKQQPDRPTGRQDT
jgi:hypothetical protein